MSSDYLGWLLVVWAAIAIATVLLRWRWRRPGVGLVAAYLIYLAWIHWVPAVLYVTPWYWPLYSTEIVAKGFVQSLVGVAGFAVGALALSRWRRSRERAGAPPPEPAPAAFSDPRWPAAFFWLGMVGYFLVTPLVGRIPTFGVVATVQSNLLYAGAILLWWQSNRSGRSRTKLFLLALAGLWPLVTVSGQGFLGAGLTLPTLLFLFVARNVRRPARAVLIALIGVVMVYVTLSVAVSYSANRDAIRAVVWNQEASQQEQIGASLLIFERFQWFNPRNEEHLDRIELHTNQNHLVGRAVDRIDRGVNQFALGSTLGDVVLMLIPRAIWPDKPVRVGGSAYVSQYTGVIYGGSTSVGMGQIMEFHVNFGVLGVFFGMMVFGLAITALDEAAANAIARSNWLYFALWYVPALSLLQTGNNMVTLVAGFVSSWLVIFVAIKLWTVRKQERRRQLHPYSSR